MRIFLALALAFSVTAQILPRGVKQNASMAGITEYEFPNGLRVLLYPDDANPKTTVNMIYLVGSRHEGYGETGMAHLLEHLLFIETTNGRQIKKELVDHGAQWNGTTSLDRTNYFETVTATDDNLRWALGLEADRMVNVKMEKKILDTEMSVVRNEFERGENSPRNVLDERVTSTAYVWHNYGKSTIGSREDIERVPIERLAAFYRKYYRPDNAVLTLAGKLDVSKTLAIVAETVGRIPKPAGAIEHPYTVEPPQDGERYVELRRVGSGQEIMMAYHGPAARHPDSPALQVLAGVMGGGFRFQGGQGRFSKALVDNKKALTAGMSFRPLYDPGLVMVTASLSKEQSLDDARKALIDILEGIIKEPPTQDEVDRVKNRMIRSMEQRMADAQQVGLAMTGPVSQGDWRLQFWEHEQIKKVTPDDLVRIAKTYFKSSNRTVGVFIPEAAVDRTVVPDAPSFDSLFRDFKTTVTVSQGEAFEPTPENIEKRVVRRRLSNGLSVIMLPKKTGGGTISAILELRFGDEKTLAGKNAASSMVASLLMRGTKTKTRQQLQDAIDKLNARVSVGSGGFAGGRRGGPSGGAASLSSIGASIEAKPENFAAALRLAVEILREPAFPENDFELIRKQRLAGIDAQRTEPNSLAGMLISRTMSPYPKGHPRYVGTLDEQAAEWRGVTLDDVRNFHAAFFGASTGEFVVIGEIDQPALLKELETHFGGWRSRMKYSPLATPYRQVAAINQKIETPDKENAQFEAVQRLKLKDTDLDYLPLRIANYIFGGSISARMPDRIRNREGLSYGARSGISVTQHGESGVFSASVSSNPINTPKVEASFLDELKIALRDGFTQAELDAARKAFLDGGRIGRSQDGALLRLLQTREEMSRTLHWDMREEARIAALTLAEVNAAFRKHIDPSLILLVKAGDFKKAGVWQQ
jgi:zinc protease